MFGFNELKIQSKLMALFGAIIFIGVVITGWTVLAISNLDRLTGELEDVEFELSDAVQHKNLIKEMEVAEISYVLTDDAEFLHQHEQVQEDVTVFIRDALIRTDDPVIKNVLHQLEAEFNDYRLEMEQVVEAVHQGEFEQARDRGEESAAELEQMAIEIDKIINAMRPELAARAAQSQRQVTLSGIVGAAALVLFLALAVGAGMVVNRQVSQPILILMEAAARVESGGFDPAPLQSLVGREDEIGHLARSFIRMAEDVRGREAALQAEAEDLRQKLAQL